MVAVHYGGWSSVLRLPVFSAAVPAGLPLRSARFRALRFSLFLAPPLSALLEAMGARPRRGAQSPRAGRGLWKAGSIRAPREVRERNETALIESAGKSVFSYLQGAESYCTRCSRLFWPKSRCYDYLYQEAEALLKNFPVQATISFYEDSDSEEDEGELEQHARTESHC